MPPKTSGWPQPIRFNRSPIQLRASCWLSLSSKWLCVFVLCFGLLSPLFFEGHSPCLRLLSPKAFTEPVTVFLRAQHRPGLFAWQVLPDPVESNRLLPSSLLFPHAYPGGEGQNLVKSPWVGIFKRKRQSRELKSGGWKHRDRQPPHLPLQLPVKRDRCHSIHFSCSQGLKWLPPPGL